MITTPLTRSTALPVILHRLKRGVNLDGNAVYSAIQEVNVADKHQLQVFPSPAQNILYVQTTNSGEKISGLFNIAGQNILPGLRMLAIGNGFYSIDISSLPKGIYIVKTTSAAVKIIKN